MQMTDITYIVAVPVRNRLQSEVLKAVIERNGFECHVYAPSDDCIMWHVNKINDAAKPWWSDLTC